MKKTVEKIREFNRFYTIKTGFLNNKYNESEFSTIEARILYELKNNKGVSQNYLVKTLKIDKSYLCRIIKRFEKEGLLDKTVSENDARSSTLNLTKKGEDVVSSLVCATNEKIGEMIAHLNKKECEELCTALDLVQKYLSDKKAQSKEQEAIWK